MNVQTTLHPYGWQNLDHLVTVNAWMCSNWGFVQGRPRRGGLHGGARPACAPGAVGNHRRGDGRADAISGQVLSPATAASAGSHLDDLSLGGDGDPRIGPEARRELIERIVGPVRLVVGQQDPPGTSPAA